MSADGPDTATNTAANTAANAASIGVDAAKDVVGLAAKVMDEVLAGLESATHRGNALAGAAARNAGAVVAKVGGTTGGGTAGGSGAGAANGAEAPSGQQPAASLIDSQLVSQLFDLAQQVLKVAGDAAGRIMQTGLGPIEKMLDRDSNRHDDVWVDLGDAHPGHTAKGTFDLENATTHPAEVTLVITNPLASMKGTIPVSQVRCSPNPVQLPPAADDGPGTVSVDVAVDIPMGTPPGRYLGILRSTQVGDLTVILGVDVV